MRMHARFAATLSLPLLVGLMASASLASQSPTESPANIQQNVEITPELKAELEGRWVSLRDPTPEGVTKELEFCSWPMIMGDTVQYRRLYESAQTGFDGIIKEEWPLLKQAKGALEFHWQGEDDLLMFKSEGFSPPLADRFRDIRMDINGNLVGVRLSKMTGAVQGPRSDASKYNFGRWSILVERMTYEGERIPILQFPMKGLYEKVSRTRLYAKCPEVEE